VDTASLVRGHDFAVTLWRHGDAAAALLLLTRSNCARKVLANSPLWLLGEVRHTLDEDQAAIRSMLGERFHWNDATAC
jgi:hypothetical protein